MASIYRAFADRALPENYFRVEVAMLRNLGIELIREESVYYKIYSRLALFYIVYSFTCGEAYELYSQWGDLNAVVRVMNYLLSHFLGAVKVTLLFWNRKKIGNIIKILHRAPFKPDVNRGGKIEEAYIRNIIRTTEIQYVVFFFLISMTINCGVINFFKRRIFDDREKWDYPYVPITLVDTTYSPMFEFACIYQISCVYSYAWIIGTIDVLLSVLIAHLSIHMEIVQNAFRLVHTRINILMKNDAVKRPLEYYAEIVLGEYIHHHLETLQLVEDMEELCNITFLIIFLSSIFQMCFLLYQTSLLPLQSVLFIQNFFYYWIIFWEVGMNCYWGNEITEQAANVAQAATDFDWTCLPPRLTKTLVVVIRRSQKPLQITAGKFASLSLTAFLSILKGSFSYFMVMRQRGGEE